MAQQIQRDPLAVATGGLPGLAGITFAPIPATEGDVAARQRATVPQFGIAPAQVIRTPTFRPTAQAVLPTPLLRRPETVGQQAFRPIQQEVVFPTLARPEEEPTRPAELAPARPAETIEEVEQRLTALITPPAEARGLPVETLGGGSLLEPPVPPPPPVPVEAPPAIVAPPAPPTPPVEERPPEPPRPPEIAPPPPPPVFEAKLPETREEAPPQTSVTAPEPVVEVPSTTTPSITTELPPATVVQEPVMIAPPPPPPAATTPVFALRPPEHQLLQLYRALSEPGEGGWYGPTEVTGPAETGTAATGGAAAAATGAATGAPVGGTTGTVDVATGVTDIGLTPAFEVGYWGGGWDTWGGSWGDRGWA